MTSKLGRIQENANKYIVRNCPSAKYRMGMPWKILCEKESNCVKSIYCAGCTNCVIKRVVDKCNKYKSIYPVMSSVYIFINEILDVFDIEEINK